MRFQTLACAALLASAAAAATKGPAVASGENSLFRIDAKLYKDHQQVKQLLGDDIEKGIVVVEVTITPKGQPVEIWRDDFIIRSDKDGQKSEPYDPGQIAGNSVLTLIYAYEGAAVAQEDRGPVWGGAGGGMPGRLPGQGSGIGNTAAVETASATEVTEDPEEVTNPLLRTLREKILPEEKITGPVTGYLYYPLEGKHKPKQVWLHYVGEGGKIDLRFRRPH